MAMALGGGDEKSQDERLQQARKIATVKLEAADRLAGHADATEDQLVEGRRGQLQGLSHLAQLGDLKSAQRLETLAAEYADDPSRDVQVDSRLVLIGFALEKLQNGKPGIADDLVRMTRELGEIAGDENVMAMVTMAQARQWLAKLEHNDQAATVRRLILETFGRSTDPDVAQMAAQYAGNVRFDEIDALVNAVATGRDVSAARWRESVDTLLDVAPDIMSVRYLCGTTLQFEANDQADLAAITYNTLEQRFADDETAIGDDVRLALELRDARRAKIGRPFDVPVAAVQGTVTSIDDLKGQVVLMPFWSTQFPDSLQLIPLLRQLESEHPETVSVIGMNLDASESAVRDWMNEVELDLPTVRATTTGETQNVSPVARQFGMGGRPMTLVIDQTGTVAAIEFGDARLKKIVEDLLATQ